MLAHANAHNILLFFFSVPVFPEREILGYLFPPQGVEVAGANRNRPGSSGQQPGRNRHTRPGQQGRRKCRKRRNRNTPGGVGISLFFRTVKKGIFAVIAVLQKRGISGIFGHRKKGVFVRGLYHDWGHVQRTGKVEFPETIKKAGTVPVFYVETGRLRAFIPVEVLAVVPWDWRAYRAKGGPIRERLEALAVPGV